MYYLTEACGADMGRYLGTGGRGLGYTLDYNQFVGYTFQLLVGLQSIHRLGLHHNDVKPANVIVCGDTTDFDNILYNYNGERYWCFSYGEVLRGNNIKVFDFGDVKIPRDMTQPCLVTKDSVALVPIVKIMWNSTVGEKDQGLFNQLIQNLQACETNLLDVMLESAIFNPFTVGCSPGQTHVVNLLV